MAFATNSPWTDIDGIAARFGVKPTTIYEWMKLDPPIPSSKVGGTRRFFIPDVDEWAHTESRWSLHMDQSEDVVA